MARDPGEEPVESFEGLREALIVETAVQPVAVQNAPTLLLEELARNDSFNRENML